MRGLLLDTHIVLAVLQNRLSSLARPMREVLGASTNIVLVSVVSLWEIDIKVRIGKLPLDDALPTLPALLAAAELVVLPIEAAHALTAAEPEPATHDPFDRLLLSQCMVEDLRLVTLDRALAAHPLVWRPE